MSVFASLDPNLRPWAKGLYDVAREYGLRPRVHSTFRGNREQALLYRRFLEGRSSLPAAPPGRSLHNFGHAFDMTSDVPGAQDWLGAVWESWGGRWGGRFNDSPHFDSGATIP